MRVIFCCPACGARRGASAEILGRRIRCADCLQFVTVTAQQLSPVEPEGTPAELPLQGKLEMDQPEDQPQIPPSDELVPLEAATEMEVVDEAAPLRMLSADDVVEVSPTEAVGGIAGEEPGKKKPIGRWKEAPDDSDLLSPVEESDEEGEKVGFGGKVDKEAMEMDMTPMVDVTFLLLIFFMVTASFTMMRTIRQPPPNSDEPSTITQENEDDPDQIVVFIDEFNTYTVLYGPVDAEAPSVQELYVRLKEAIDSGPVPPTKLMIQAHGDATHEKVVIAMDAGTEVGLSEVQVMLTEKESL